MSDNNICFFIAPIGGIDSEIRKRSDQLLNHVIRPAAQVFEYEAIRADQISEPGIITTQVVQHIMDDAMVVADLTGKNPNVFYELAIRHAIRKPYVQIIQRGEEKPFDVAGVRTIEIDHHDLDSVQSAKEEIVKQISSMKKEGYLVDSPISITIDFERLKKSENPEQRQLADVLSAMADLRSGLASIEKKLEDAQNIQLIGSPKKLRNMDKKLRELVLVSRHSSLDMRVTLEEILGIIGELNSTINDSIPHNLLMKDKISRLMSLALNLRKEYEETLFRNEELIHSIASV